jgi:hypothetical protein
VNKAWQRYLEAASGLTETTQHRAEQVVKSLVRQGELAAERAEKAVDDLLKRSEQNRKAFSAIVRASLVAGRSVPSGRSLSLGRSDGFTKLLFERNDVVLSRITTRLFIHDV